MKSRNWTAAIAKLLGEGDRSRVARGRRGIGAFSTASKVLLVVVLLSHALAHGHEGHDALPTQGATVRGDRLLLSASAAKAIGVAIGKVELAEVRRTIHAVASVELPWTQQAIVTALVAGKVEEVLVKPGETISAGQELARVSSLELENLQLEMLQASTELAFASRLLARQEEAGEGIAGRVILQTRTETRQLAARFHAAWQKLRAIGLTEDRLEAVRTSGNTVATLSIPSPIAGVVSVSDVRPGQMVQPTDHLYHIVDLSRVWVVGKVLEADAGRIRRGLGVRVTFATLTDQDLAATIDHVELRLNEDRTLSVKALLDNPAGTLKPGMFGRMEIQIEAEMAVVCPKEAVTREGLASYALVRQSAGTYVRKKVVVGPVRGQRAEIEDGLFPGDQVVTVGNHELASLFANRPAVLQTPSPGRSDSPVTIAQARVELPTDQKAFASAAIGGRIRRILVEHGQSVRKGEVLAELESLPFQSLQLDLLQARTDLDQASVNLARARVLSQSDSIARKDLWHWQTQHDRNQHTLASLRRKLTLAGLSDGEIRRLEATDLAGSELTAVLSVCSPADGLIAEFGLIPGQVVAAETQLFEIHQPDRIWIQAFLFEQDAVGVSVGQAVRVTLASDPAFRADGRVDRLNPLLSSGNRALSIWVELDNPGLRLKEGMSAIVAIDRPKHSVVGN